MSELRDLSQQLCNAFLQEIVQYQMVKAFGDKWVEKVYENTISKLSSSEGGTQRFSVKNIIEKKGASNVKSSDFDITICSSIILFDFIIECSNGFSSSDAICFRKLIKKIRNTKNDLMSHIPDINNLAFYYKKCDEVADELSSALNLLKSKWKDPYAHEFYERFFPEISLLKQQIKSESLNLEKTLNDNLYNEISKRLKETEEIEKQFIGLTYASDTKGQPDVNFEALVQMAMDRKSFKLNADAGYGKTFTLKMITRKLSGLFENASQCIYPIYIPLKLLTNSYTPICDYLLKKYCINNGALLENLLQKNIILLLDAMDEVSCLELKKNIHDELFRLSSLRSNISVVGTSRKSDINYFLDYSTYNIKQMNDKEIEDYIYKNIDLKYQEKAKEDWIKSKSFLSIVRIPFYISCYSKLANMDKLKEFNSTSDLIDYFLDNIICREFELLKSTIEPGKANLFLTKLCIFLDEKRMEFSSLSEFRNAYYDQLRIEVETNPRNIEKMLNNLAVILLQDNTIGFAANEYRESFERRYLMDKLKYDF